MYNRCDNTEREEIRQLQLLRRSESLKAFKYGWHLRGSGRHRQLPLPSVWHKKHINEGNKFSSHNYGNLGVWRRSRRTEWLQRSLLVDTGGECRPVLQNIDYLSDFIICSWDYNIGYIIIMIHSCRGHGYMYTTLIFQYEEEKRRL